MLGWVISYLWNSTKLGENSSRGGAGGDETEIWSEVDKLKT